MLRQPCEGLPIGFGYPSEWLFLGTAVMFPDQAPMTAFYVDGNAHIVYSHNDGRYQISASRDIGPVAGDHEHGNPATLAELALLLVKAVDILGFTMADGFPVRTPSPDVIAWGQGAADA